jgi:hypothetical protein
MFIDILDSYIAINTLTLIYDTIIKNKKKNNFKIILKVQSFTSEQISDHKILAPPKKLAQGAIVASA